MGSKPRPPVPSSWSKCIDHAIGWEVNTTLIWLNILVGREVRLERALVEKTGRSNALHIASTKGAVTWEVGSLFRYCTNAPTRALMNFKRSTFSAGWHWKNWGQGPNLL